MSTIDEQIRIAFAGGGWPEGKDAPILLLDAAAALERVQTLLGMVAVHLEHPELGGLSESQKLAISEWYEHFREQRVTHQPTGNES